MAIRMAALNLSATGATKSRKAIPKDARAEYKRLYGVSHEAILVVPAGTSTAQAKALHGQWLAEVETRIERIRAAAKGAGQPLTHRNALALAGRWYKWFVARHESDRWSPEHWQDRKEHLTERVWYPHAPVEHLEDPNADPSWPWTQWPEVREAVRAEVAEMALVASFLASEGLALTPDASILFVDAVSQRLFNAYALLEARAKGDYTRDTYPDTFPAYVDQRRGASTGMSCWELFGAYVAARKPAASTISRWRAVFNHLQAAFPGSAGDLTEDNAWAWKDTLLTAKRSARTVDAVWLPAVKTVFSWAVTQKQIRSNPFVTVKIDVPKVVVLREEGKAFKLEEANIILRASLSVQNTRDAFPRAKRWVMWLCAYSGARAGEVTQLRGVDITQRGNLYAMRLTPEAGSIKTGSARTVPLHEHLIAQGFIEFVHAQGNGPLFYNARETATTEPDPLNPERSPSVKTRGRLGAWVRELGIPTPKLVRRTVGGTRFSRSLTGSVFPRRSVIESRATRLRMRLESTVQLRWTTWLKRSRSSHVTWCSVDHERIDTLNETDDTHDAHEHGGLHMDLMDPQEPLAVDTKRPAAAEATLEERTAMFNAVHAPLMGWPVSDQGRAVVTRLREAITAHERAVNPRKYSRGKTGAKFDKAIGAFVADLLLAQAHKKAKGWIQRSLRPVSFDNGPVTRTQGRAVVEGLVALGLLRRVDGYAQMTGFGPSHYVSPKLRAEPAMLKLAQECGVDPDRAEEHFTKGPPKDLVIVKAASVYDGYKKIKGKVLKVDVPQRLWEEVQELNAYLDGFTLGHGTHRGFFRSYNNGDRPGFDFDRGGRFYSAGEDSYQNLPTEERLKLTINGEGVAEVDVRASFMTILYAMHKLQFDGDPYVISGLGSEGRRAVKMFVASTIGNGAPIEKWSRKHTKDFFEDTGLRLGKRWPLPLVAQAALEKHPILRKLDVPIKGRKRDWSDLMWIESQAILRTMLDLKRNYQVPSYPVHDSLIVPKSKADRTVAQLNAHYFGELMNYHSPASLLDLRVSIGAA